jgi:exosortase A
MTVHTTPKIGLPIATPSTLRGWLPTLLGIAAFCALFGVAFQHEIAGAIRVWNDSTAYNHCFLVLPLAGALLWMRRDILVQMRPQPAWWPLLLLPAASGLWLVAALLDVLEAEQLSVVLLFEILLLAILGWRMFRVLLAPLLFLFFLVPFGAFLVPALQVFTAKFTVYGLQLLGIPVFADGFIIQIPEGTFEVAEACAGLRFLIASIVFGCFFATVVYQSKWRRSIFITLSLIVPIVANGFRALGLVVLGHILGDAAAAMTDHILYGWLFFTIVTLVLIAIGIGFKENAGPDPAFAGRTAEHAAPASWSRIAAVVVSGLLLALVGPAYLLTLERASAAALLGPEIVSIPAQSGGWVREPAAPDDWLPTVPAADRVSTVAYRKGGAIVTEFAALFRLPKRGSVLTRAGTDAILPEPWRLVETGRSTASFEGSSVVVNTATIARGGTQRYVWWFYVVDGHPTGRVIETKFWQIVAALPGGPHYGALIAIATDRANGEPPDETVLRSFLNAVHKEPGTAALPPG